ncbi:hypothetical protein V6R21_29070 [Limibacter armeniacum]|uniref:hypothetical protein n=1 Tax=Limibacter armeniacum TaxID=466084 RepID=UPI002FE51AC1
MTTAEFEAALHFELYDFFNDRDFGFIPSKHQYRKLTPDGFQNVIFTTTTYEGDEHIMEVSIGTRIDKVEDFVQPYLYHTNVRSLESNTVVMSLGRIRNQKYFRYIIRSPKDIGAVASDVEDFMYTTGIRFLEENCRVDMLDIKFNKYPEHPCNIIYNQSHRCFKGLTLARLNHNPHFYALQEIYEETLMKLGTDKDTVRNFKKMAKRLIDLT